MLSRPFVRSGVRCFSADPHYLHLEKIEDKFPQYAHLHWHTVDKHEVGKYADLRRTKYADHIQDDPHPVDWTPGIGREQDLTLDGRNGLYGLIDTDYLNFQLFLRNEADYHDHHERPMIETYNDAILAHIDPEQIKNATKVGKSLVEEYKKAGVRFTRQSIAEKTTNVILESLDNTKIGEIEHALEPYLEVYGYGIPMGPE